MSWKETTDRIMGQVVKTFGETVSYEAAGESAVEIEAVFDRESTMIDPNTGAQIVSYQPMISVRLSDLAKHPTNGDKVSVRGVLYRISSIEDDGQGGARLILHKSGGGNGS